MRDMASSLWRLGWGRTEEDIQWAPEYTVLRRQNRLQNRARRSTWGMVLAAATLALQLGCGNGLQLGAMVGEKMMGDGTADSAGAQAALPPLPDPLQPIPPGSLYGHEVVARMRAVRGGEQKRLWKSEFKDKQVAGQGRVLKGDVQDFFGTMYLVVELDLDADGQVDMVIKSVTTDIMATRSVSEGRTVWYEGRLNEYDGHVIVGGDHVRVIF